MHAPSSYRAAAVVAGLVLAFLATVQPAHAMEPLKPSATARSDTRLLGRNEFYAVVRVDDTVDFAQLAQEYLGNAAHAWQIIDANANWQSAEPGTNTVIIPLEDENRSGVYPDGYQVVPILTYHRFEDSPHRLSVSPTEFAQHMEYLREHDFRVIKLDELSAFLRGERAIPRRSVVITIDDGYTTTYSEAFPILRRYGFPATLYIYTDFIENGGVTWAQLKEMKASGLISVQPHSKTHANLKRRRRNETDTGYRARIATEIRTPKQLLETRLNIRGRSFAYPFGAANAEVVEFVRDYGFELGLTVDRGGNPSFGYPYGLRRSMVYGGTPMRTFAKTLRVYVHHDLGFSKKNSAKSVNQAEANALLWAEEGDLARALREWRVIDAVRSSAETTRAMRSLETSIAAKAKRLLTAAKRHQVSEQNDRAVQLTLAALALDPNRTEPRRVLEAIYAQRALTRIEDNNAGERPQFETTLRDMIDEYQVERARPLDEVERASAQRARGNYEAAILELLRAQANGRGTNTQLQEQFALTRSEYAQQLYLRGEGALYQDPKQAINYLRQALFHDPGHAQARQMLSYAQKKLRTPRSHH